MRVLVFGAGGQVGAELVTQAVAAGHEVTGLSRAQHDVTDAAATRARILDSGAEVVFNGAAYNAVDRAETEPDMARGINAIAPGVMAAACAESGALMVHYSTDYVFDGSARAPIPEDALPRPLGIYGQSKREGEEAVLAAAGRRCVIRTAWVYGEGSNFVRTVLRVTRERGEMRVVNDQVGAPTWARDLAAASLELAETDPDGIYHLTNAGSCSWFELATAAVRLAGIEAALTPITTAEYPAPARRPAYSVLANARWEREGHAPLRPWADALAVFVAEVETSR